MRKFILAVTMAAAAAAATAQATFEFVNTRALVQLLRSSTRTGSDDVSGYIAGVAAALDRVRFCIPENTSMLALNQATKNYLDAHAETWNQPSGTVIADALRMVWPCSTKTDRAAGPTL